MARAFLIAAACVASTGALQITQSVHHIAVRDIGAASRSQPVMLLGMGGKKPAVPRTVGEAKAAFQKEYGRPVSTLAQSFVSEMLTSVTLATAAPSYKYTSVFAVGFEALCDSFLTAIPNEQQREQLKSAMCVAVELDSEQLKKDADALKAIAASKTEDDLLALPELKVLEGQKYSYPVGAGLLTLMPLVDAPPNAEVIKRWSTALGVSPVRLEKDWMFFEKALKQMADARTMMMEMQASAKRKEAKALKEKAEKAAAAAEEAEKEAA